MVALRSESASAGSLEPQTLADLVALKKFSEAQVAAFEALWEGQLPSSRLREHMLRLIVIEFGFGRTNSAAYYQAALSLIFRDIDITTELSHLEELSLVSCDDGGDLVPTSHLVGWYNRLMPSLMEAVAEMIRSR